MTSTPRPLVPCLWFDSNAREAAQFYTSVFPRSRITGEMLVQQADHPTGKPVGSTLAVTFELEGLPYFALDGGPGFPFTQAVSLQTYVDTQPELDERWDALVAGGSPQQCGWLVDRFGFHWQVIPSCFLDVVASGDQAAIGRAHAAILTMVKPDVAAIEAAIRGE